MHSLFLPSSRSSASATATFAPQTSAPPQPRIAPTPRAKWPVWIRAIAKFRHSEDTGIGDTILHLIGDSRSEKFKQWFTRKFGKTCGCTERQRWLNWKYPYED